jgi:hypothetical protein
VQAGLDVGAIGIWNSVGHLSGLDGQVFSFCTFNEDGIFIRLLSWLDVFQISRLHKAFNVVCYLQTLQV